jgi:hypothetical protein
MKHLPKSFTIARIESGKLIADKQAIARDTAKMKDGDVSIEIKPYVRSKTWEQLKAFHGVIVPQVKAFIEDREGISYTIERIKDDLKNTFLSKAKQFYSDGTPVMVKMAHPDKPKVSYLWHFERVPSLADLKVDEMNQFISDIIAHFWEKHGESIVIDSPER